MNYLENYRKMYFYVNEESFHLERYGEESIERKAKIIGQGVHSRDIPAWIDYDVKSSSLSDESELFTLG